MGASARRHPETVPALHTSAVGLAVTGGLAEGAQALPAKCESLVKFGLERPAQPTLAKQHPHKASAGCQVWSGLRGTVITVNINGVLKANHRNAVSINAAKFILFCAVVNWARTIRTSIYAWFKTLLIQTEEVKIHRFSLALLSNVKQSLQNSLSL